MRAGIPEKVAMSISGHKTRNVFERYNIVDSTDLKNAATRIGEHHKKSEEKMRHGHNGGHNGSIEQTDCGECASQVIEKMVPLTGIEPVRQLPVERF